MVAASAVAWAQMLTTEERLLDASAEGKPLVAEGIVAHGKVNLGARNRAGESPLHAAALHEVPYYAELSGVPHRAIDRQLEFPNACLARRSCFSVRRLRADSWSAWRKPGNDHHFQWSFML